MVRIKYKCLSLLVLFLFILNAILASVSLAEEETKPRGTLKVVDFWGAAFAVKSNYAEGLVTLDKDNNRLIYFIVSSMRKSDTIADPCAHSLFPISKSPIQTVSCFYDFAFNTCVGYKTKHSFLVL